MNRNGSILDKTLSSPLALILVFVIMLLFVVIASFSSINGYEDYSLIDDFLDDLIIFDGKVISVNDAINMMCKDELLEPSLKIILRESFRKNYGERNAFVITSAYGYFTLHSWAGAFDSLNEDEFRPGVSVKDLLKEFPSKDSRVRYKPLCTDLSSSTFAIYTRSGGIDES